MGRSIRIAGRLLWLGLLSGALALPLGAEEITVTIPPDDPPAQTQPAQQGFDPTAHPTDDAPMPSSSAQADPAPEEPAPAAQPEAAAPPPAAEAPAEQAPPAAAETTPTPPPVVKKAHKKVKKAAAPTPAGESTAEAPAAAKPVKKKTKSAKASCLNLTEDQCGGNTACIWVGAGTNDAGKAVKARCRSMAILKRESEKAAKAEKSKGPEVLPWAAGGAPASTATAATAEAKPVKKKKTASAKKTTPKPAEAPAVAPSTSDASGAD